MKDTYAILLFLFCETMTLDDAITPFDVEKETRENTAQLITEERLRCTQGLLPWVLTILEKLGAPIPSPIEVQLAFMQYGQREYDGAVSIPTSISDGLLPQHFPTLFGLQRMLPNRYLDKPVPIFNSSYNCDIPFSLARSGDDIYVRCHRTREELNLLLTLSNKAKYINRA